MSVVLDNPAIEDDIRVANIIADAECARKMAERATKQAPDGNAEYMGECARARFLNHELHTTVFADWMDLTAIRMTALNIIGKEY